MIFDVQITFSLCSSLGWGTPFCDHEKLCDHLFKQENHVLSGFVNRGFLFVTSSQKIKNHVMETQITLLVCPCLSLTQKQHTFNHMIIYNNSISKFCHIIRGFCQGISMFFSICLAKRNVEVIKF